MKQELNEIARWSTLADFYELFGVAFSFPEEPLARAVSTGALFGDLEAIGAELECPAVLEGANRPEAFARKEPSELLVILRRSYSQLYLEPGRLRRVYPYESAFAFAESHESGMPTLVVTRAALSVEHFMRRARALPEDRHSRPVDSIECEFGLMGTIWENALVSASQGEEAMAREWEQLAGEFKGAHLDMWVNRFMERTVQEAPESFQGLMARAYLEIDRKGNL
ncbi:molecular chaperone TorD family protein [Adlercreutzia sp. R7]|uniref:Molecular chaperone TorD family protein n=1 Tax=Adlercreutzia wanghongyangiae TaxID=3111451 RepID=A0ABU6IGH6_9ACTN|nr:molecular chaperone TorD family protein [Adlercreutzia sp. R7]